MLSDAFGCFDSYKHMVCVGLTIACISKFNKIALILGC